jgi:probable rRNA maturation factor
MPKEADSSRSLAIDVRVEAGKWPSKAKLTALATRSLAAALARAKPKLAAGPELSLLFTDDAHVRVLNRQYRRKDKATNVLSFPTPKAARAKAFGPQLGDIVLADHLAHLIVHGFLHLLGHDHEDDREAAVMEKLETAILARLGIADPYGGADA